MIRQNDNEVIFDFPSIRDPKVASSLSLIPGLGQIYNSEPRKGVLFFLVALTNMAILATLTFNKALIDCLQALGQDFNITPNKDIVEALSAYHAGSPACNVLLLLFLAFIAFSMRDAFDRARQVRRNSIYAPCVMHISEAASGSYLFHNVLMATLVIFAFFFLLPAPPQVQITEIQFVNSAEPAKKPPQTDKRATTDADELRSKNPFKVTHDPSSSAAPTRANANKSETQPDRKVEPTPQADSRPKNVNPPKSTAPAAEPIRAEAPHTEPAPVKPMPINKPVLPTPSSLSTPNPIMAHNAAANNDIPTLKAPMNSPKTVSDVTKLLDNIVPAAAPTKIASAFSPGGLTVRTAGDGAPPTLPTSGAVSEPGSRLQPAPSESSNKHNSGSAREPKDRDRGTGSQLAMTDGPSSGPSPSKRPGTFGGDAAGLSGPKPDVKAPGNGNSIGNNDRNGCSLKNGKDNDDQEAGVAVDFGPYMLQLQRRIKANWFPPKDTLTKKVLVRFVISKNGTLSDLRLVHSSGTAIADNAALKAVSNAAPFANLPKGSPESVDIEFTFDYRVWAGKMFDRR